MTALAVSHYPHQPKGWHRARCRSASCRRAATRGGLCAPCGERFLAVVNDRLRRYGIEETDAVAVTADGYLTIRVGGQFVGEHRVIMRHHLGRDFYPGENVHHLNGCRTDNRLENLELWVTHQPAGQRPRDLVAYAREILRRYPELDRPQSVARQ